MRRFSVAVLTGLLLLAGVAVLGCDDKKAQVPAKTYDLPKPPVPAGGGEDKKAQAND